MQFQLLPDSLKALSGSEFPNSGWQELCEGGQGSGST
jgi:hypothetical protein